MPGSVPTGLRVLAFDVFGTVVDWRTGVIAEVTAVAREHDLSVDAAAIADATARQEKIIATMQEILKQMSQWDSFVDVLNQLNEIIKLETKVHLSTDQMKKKQTEGIFD